MFLSPPPHPPPHPCPFYSPMLTVRKRLARRLDSTPPLPLLVTPRSPSFSSRCFRAILALTDVGCKPSQKMELEGVSERHYAMFTWSFFVISQDRLAQAHTTHKVDCLFFFLSTFRPCCGFTLLLCATIASFAAISDRVILAELEGILVLSFF